MAPTAPLARFFCFAFSVVRGLPTARRLAQPAGSPLPPPPTRTRCACLINYCWAAGGRWCGGAEGRALWVNFGCCAIVHKWFVYVTGCTLAHCPCLCCLSRPHQHRAAVPSAPVGSIRVHACLQVGALRGSCVFIGYSALMPDALSD